jgi:MoxR-like ATPase
MEEQDSTLQPGEPQGQAPQQMFEQRNNMAEVANAVQSIRAELAKIIVGQHKMVELILAAIFTKGHVLIEGVPGVAKTLTAKLLSRTVDAGFSRIQFTPDLMPSDVTGMSIFNAKTNEFEFRKGPVFSNFILIDEINRAPAKTQASLFEVMEERQITADGQRFILEEPFIVLATQNPVEQEGTYRLPEAQLDRFMFKIEVGYPSVKEETAILLSHHEGRSFNEHTAIAKILTKEKINEIYELIQKIHVDQQLLDYIAKLVDETRNNPSLYLGASPRASIALLKGAKALAAIQGRDFVTPEDIRNVSYPVLGHRIMATPEKEMEGTGPKEIVEEIISKVDVPR